MIGYRLGVPTGGWAAPSEGVEETVRTSEDGRRKREAPPVSRLSVGARLVVTACVFSVGCFALAACDLGREEEEAGDRETREEQPTTAAPDPGAESRVGQSGPPATVKVVAAGDLASCETRDDEVTAALAGRLRPHAILTLGDNAYPDGTRRDFHHCYSPSWGRFLGKTLPAPGNHDYQTPRARAYFAYFRRRAPGPYYSRNLGRWHVVSLNSEIDVGAGSAQERWLRADLARDRHRCELLYWHRPRWSGGGSEEGMQALWRAAYRHGVELVLSGHSHNYQRFRPLDAAGRRDRRFGVRQIVAGTGGGGRHHPLAWVRNRVSADSTTYGVVLLALRPRSYALRFVPAADGTFRDRLRGAPCHRAPPRR
ncbi:MAG: metallophosphoesterase [Actinomycetota bacterium]|nr:metallophosphoesterase [Actinomycetota bacterium]